MTKTRKAVVLGAGIYQVPLIKRLKKRGFYVVTVSYRDTDPGISYGDYFWLCDTKNKEEIYKRCLQEEIDIVLTTGTDVAIPTIGYINEKLNLKGVNQKQAVLTSSKIEMKKAFAEKEVRTSEYATATSINDAVSVSDKIGYPVMVKAPDSSGSRGIIKADNPDEVIAAFNEAVRYSASNEIIVEQYLVGLEFGAQTVVQNGKLIGVFAHNDEVIGNPISVPVGHSIPFKYIDDLTDKINEVCLRSIKALGIQDAICNFDLMYSEDEIYVMEVASRIGATGIPEIIDASYNIDLYDVQIDLILGNQITLNSDLIQKSSYSIIRSKSSGNFQGITINNLLLEEFREASIQIDIKKEEKVNEFKVGPDRIGSILIVGESDSVISGSERVFKNMAINVLQ